jgi:hypothetical protein
MKYALVYDSANCHITGDCLRKSIPENEAIHLDLSGFSSNAEIEQLLETTTASDRIPGVILHEIGAHGLPRGLDRVSIPTGCLDIDTFGWTRFRLTWAMLFDYVFTWHPSYIRRPVFCRS